MHSGACLLYVGLSNDPQQRFKNHNKGATKFTKGYRLWILFYVEEIGALKETRAREKFLKSGSGREFLKSLKNKV